ncbi:MAG: hypothetical protein KDB01_04750, partial [Planctomycetaceae bacterium]|nr:hypothetical protein [Planctomycetaceae bacterium]
LTEHQDQPLLYSIQPCEFSLPVTHAIWKILDQNRQGTRHAKWQKQVIHRNEKTPQNTGFCGALRMASL